MISDNIRHAFGLKGIEKPLEGGQGSSIKFNQKVLKPVDDPEYYNWCMALLDQLQPQGYRISKPVATDNGYTYSGYGATYFEPGYEDDSRLEEKLQVARLLHKDLKSLSFDLKFTNDPWTKAQQVLWHKGSLNLISNPKKRDFCEQLLKSLPRIEGDYQLIHSDLGGNILFHKALDPLVIDFSPTYAPVEYGEAIIICDSIAWADCPLSSLHLLEPLEKYKPYILYAVAFRLFTIGFFDTDMDRLIEEWQAYKPIWDYINTEV